MPAIDYILSRDVKKALIDCNYQFSALEEAYLIDSFVYPIELKLKTLQELKYRSEDQLLPYGVAWMDNVNTLHEYIDAKQQAYNILKGAFFDKDDCATYYLLCGDGTEKPIYDYYEVLKHSKPSCIIKKSNNNPCFGDIYTYFGKDNEIENITLYSNAVEYEDPFGLTHFDDFPCFLYRFPCPFKVGDIVQNVYTNEILKITSIDELYYSDQDKEELFLNEEEFVTVNSRVRVLLLHNKKSDKERNTSFLFYERVCKKV